MRHVILPQAARRMVPRFVNHSVIQLKNTSLLYGERAARPARVHTGEVDLGNQGFGAVAEPLVSGQQRALPFLLTTLVGQPCPRHG